MVNWLWTSGLLHTLSLEFASSVDTVAHIYPRLCVVLGGFESRCLKEGTPRGFGKASFIKVASGDLLFPIHFADLQRLTLTHRRPAASVNSNIPVSGFILLSSRSRRMKMAAD